MDEVFGTRRVACEVGARIDLGTARALDGDLAGAEDALTLVFGLAAERRTDALTQRLGNLNRLLATRPYRGAPEAGRLEEQIAAFTAHSLGTSVRALTAADQFRQVPRRDRGGVVGAERAAREARATQTMRTAAATPAS
jgi:hypothetical protein